MPFHQSGFVVDDLDGFHIDLVGDEPEQLVVHAEVPVRQGEPGSRQRLTGSDVRGAAERPGQLDGALGSTDVTRFP